MLQYFFDFVYHSENVLTRIAKQADQQYNNILFDNLIMRYIFGKLYI